MTKIVTVISVVCFFVIGLYSLGELMHRIAQ